MRKIISFIILASFLFSTSAHSLSYSLQSNLRVRLDEPEDDRRIQIAQDSLTDEKLLAASTPYFDIRIHDEARFNTPDVRTGSIKLENGSHINEILEAIDDIEKEIEVRITDSVNIGRDITTLFDRFIELSKLEKVLIGSYDYHIKHEPVHPNYTSMTNPVKVIDDDRRYDCSEHIREKAQAALQRLKTRYGVEITRIHETKEEMPRYRHRISKIFGKTGLRFFPVGLGTVWFGREWPVGNTDYTDPSSEEIERHLGRAFATMGNEDGVIMLDTAAAYGYTEERTGRYFQKNPNLLQKTFIATKWGEDFDVSTRKSTKDYSRENLIFSVDRSLRHLKKIDLLYIHGTGTPDEVLGVLRNEEVISEMNRMKKERYGGIRYLGVSISDPEILETAIKGNLIKDFDVIQIPVSICLGRVDLIEQIYKEGIAIVINSPLRKSKNMSPEEVYTNLLSDNRISMVLTGTRHHLEETVGYVANGFNLQKLNKSRTGL